MAAELTEPDGVQLTVASCNGDPKVTELAETPTEVQVEVAGAVTDPGDACLDLVEVTLDEPLGDRTLVDLTTGRTVPVGHRLGVDT